MKKYTSEQKSIIFVVMVTSFVSTFSASALNLSIPAMSRTFNVSAGTIGWIVTCYMLSIAALSVPFGRIADITRKKHIFVPGVLIFSLASLALAFSWDFTVLLALRVLQGIGGSMILSTNTAILISAFPGSERGKVLGFSVASVYAGLSTGPIVGGIMNHYLGWRSIFILTFVLSGMVVVTAIRRLPKTEVDRSRKQSFDVLGNILYITMIVSIMYGFSEIAVSKFAAGLIVLGIILVVWFVKHELKTEDPVVQIRLFTGNTSYALSNLATLMNYGATFAVGYLLSIYLQIAMKYTSQAAGFVLIAQPVVMMLLSPFAGKLSDRISPFKLSSGGMGLCAAGIMFFVFINVHYPVWLIVLALVIVGAGIALFSSPNTNAVMSCVEPKDYGVASSLLATMRSLGQTSSMAIITLVVRTHMGHIALAQAKPAALVNTMHTIFIILIVVCVCGIFFASQRKN